MNILHCNTLDEVRDKINAIDGQIVNLIAQRSLLVNQAAQFKRSAQEVEAPKRVEQIIEKVRRLALCQELNPDIAESVYRTMIGAFINQEKKQQLK